MIIIDNEMNINRSILLNPVAGRVIERRRQNNNICNEDIRNVI